MNALEKIIATLQKINEKDIDAFAQALAESKDHRIWIMGNGGSASTSSHFASDLSSLGFDVVCLSDNVSQLTAIVNDYSWNEVYVKQLEKLKPHDVLIAISVHGGSLEWSNNLVLATVLASRKDALTLALAGNDGGSLAKIVHHSLIVPSEETYIIEGIHCVLTHMVRQKILEMTKHP